MSLPVAVELWGTSIGALSYPPGAGRVAVFEYEPAFVDSGIQLAPLSLPLRAGTFSFPEVSERTFLGLPGVFADSLPDRFGNQLRPHLRTRSTWPLDALSPNHIEREGRSVRTSRSGALWSVLQPVAARRAGCDRAHAGCACRVRCPGAGTPRAGGSGAAGRGRIRRRGVTAHSSWASFQNTRTTSRPRLLVRAHSETA